jgi:subtilisin-like proprotein convertase family protein
MRVLNLAAIAVVAVMVSSSFLGYASANEPYAATDVERAELMDDKIDGDLIPFTPGNEEFSFESSMSTSYETDGLDESPDNAFSEDNFDRSIGTYPVMPPNENPDDYDPLRPYGHFMRGPPGNSITDSGGIIEKEDPPAMSIKGDGGPSPLAVYNVQGVFQYEDRELNHTGFTGTTWMKPIRHADVEVLDDDTEAVLATTNTNATGYFSVDVTDTITRNITVRALTSSQYTSRLFNQTVETPGSVGPPQVYELRSPVYLDHLPTVNIDFTNNPVNATQSDVGGPFHIFDTAEHAEDYVENITSDYPTYELTLEWAEGVAAGKSYGLNGHIYLMGTTSDDDSYDDNVLLHEIGHYIALTYSIDANFYGGHSLEGVHDIRLTYTEGLGSYFMGAIRNFINVTQPLIYVETNGVSLNWYGFSLSMDTDTPAGYNDGTLPTFTAANEITVGHALYDIVDGIFTRDGTEGFDDDALDLPSMEGDKLVWDVLRAIKENETFLTKEITMETFVDFWIAIGQYVPEFMQILQSHEIEYFEDAFEQDDVFGQAAIKQTDGTVYHHTYYPAGDPDWSSFTGNPGEEYVIKTSELFDGADTVLELYDTDGTTLLAFNNDWEQSAKYSLISFAPTVSGQYFVKSYRFSETPKPIGEYGKYNLTIYILDNPEILTIVPNTGPVPGGTIVNITGNNFTAGATVLFGVYEATNVIVYDPNTINATSPANIPGPVNVTVLNPLNSDNVVPSGTAVDGFTYTGPALPPILHGITPDFGSTIAPTNVTVEGDYMQSAATLYFNAILCASYTVLDPKTIKATVQPLPQDLYDVNVTNPDGQYDVLKYGFESTVQGYNNTDVVFNDWTTITSTIEIQEDFIISDLYVYLNLTNPNDNTHQYNITLESPTGTIVRVYERIEVANPWGSWRTHINSTFGYDEPPSEVLWLFKGESTKGNWTLSVRVRYGQPNTLYNWGIIFFKYRHRDIARMVYLQPEWRNYVLALDEDTGEFYYRARLEGYSGWPMSLAVSSDLRYVYSSQWKEYNDTLGDWVDSHVSMFEAGTGRRLRDVQLLGLMHSGSLEPVPDRDRMVAATYRGLYVFNTTTHGQVGNVTLPERGSPRLGVTPDGKKAYVTNPSGENIDVIDLQTYTILGQIQTPSGYKPTDVDISSDGNFGVIVGENSSNEQVLIFDTTTDTIVNAIDAPYWGTVIKLTPDNTKVFYSIYQWYAGLGVLNLTTGVGGVLQISPDVTTFDLIVSHDNKVYSPDWDAAHNDLIVWNATDNSFIKKVDLADASNPAGVGYGDGVDRVNLNAAGGVQKVTLTWDEPASPGTPITSYKIYRGNSSMHEVFMTEIGPSLTYADTNVVVGQTYFYRVSAVNGRGEGPLSEEESAIPIDIIPEITNVMMVPNPQETGGNVNITCTVVDNFGVVEVRVNISQPGGGFVNDTMTRIGATDDYFHDIPYVPLGTYNLVIWASDTDGYWNSSSGHSFLIQETTLPLISDVQDAPDPQETGGAVNISANVTDNFSVFDVWLNVSYPGGGFSNVSMTRLGVTDTYFFENTYIGLGTYPYAIWANDTSNNWASASGSFEIIDSQVPVISNLVENPDPQETGGDVNITADVTDNFFVLEVWINVTGPSGGSSNVSMTRLGLTDTYYFENISFGFFRYNRLAGSDNIESGRESRPAGVRRKRQYHRRCG